MSNGSTSSRRRLGRLAVGVTALASMAPFVVAAPAHAVDTYQSSAAAANYLMTQMKNKSFGGASLDSQCLVAMAASGAQTEVTLTLEDTVRSEAKAYAVNAGTAGRMAIAAAVMGDDATNYGGVNLVKVINDSLAKDPTAGGSFSAGLAIVGLVRSHQAVPQAAIDALIKEQDAKTGAWGYDAGGFVADPDYTSAAIEALAVVPQTATVKASLAKAKAWAEAQVTKDGYWPNQYSPVNSTGLMVSALKDAGTSHPAAVSWLVKQQALTKSGGFPNVLNGTDADVMATCQALPAVVGASNATAIFHPIAWGAAGDSTGDRIADVFALDNAGNLKFYKGSTTQGLSYVTTGATGWQGTSALAQLIDPTNTARSALLARHSSDNSLWVYRSTGMGAVQQVAQFGQNWGAMDQIVPALNLAGGTTQYVVARRTDGNLYRYLITDKGLKNATLIGQNWNGMRSLVGVGDLTGDGRADVVGVRTDGTMWVYAGTAAGKLGNGREVGHGWTGFTSIFAPGDMSGDGRIDLVGRRSDGSVFVYANKSGSWGAARQIGTGFTDTRLMA